MSSSSGFSQVSSPPHSPEKSGFAPAGGLLGRDLNLGFSSNLRRGNGSAPEVFYRPEQLGNLKSLDLFPQQAGVGLDSRVCKSAPQTSQMTIFYGGRVFVFNNFPADSAGEVMLLASRESSKSNNHFSGQPILVGTPADSLSSSSPVSTHPSIFEDKNTAQNQTSSPPPQAVNRALPIARKASIQRFLEKRKDRLTARAPYQSCPLTGAPTKVAGAGAGENAWLGLAVQPQH